MAEPASNIEFVGKINEQALHHGKPSDKRLEWIEVVEAIVLAVVAVATAWSGFQATRWDALSARHYSLAARTTVLAEEKRTLAGQDRLYDITTFNAWAAAKTAGNERLADYFKRRFRPEYTKAFDAWDKLDPFNNPSAPAGAIFMPEYVNANSEASARLANEATEHFNAGVLARETGDQYIKITVFLATVLLLTAVSQRFKVLGPRLLVVTIAFILLAISTYFILTYPRL
jgi:hypothetical protein